ncbi:hypothetical protein [Phycicoccus jejuensis]|uniref:hypothetical protein n=1 Tax=Phycicoccus jejuensis TaxID=367299 RepID=UPI0004C2B4E4|nr:hypothetical protein [Phycicoccus jejuensis]
MSTTEPILVALSGIAVAVVSSWVASRHVAARHDATKRALEVLQMLDGTQRERWLTVVERHVEREALKAREPDLHSMVLALAALGLGALSLAPYVGGVSSLSLSGVRVVSALVLLVCGVGLVGIALVAEGAWCFQSVRRWWLARSARRSEKAEATQAD